MTTKLRRYVVLDDALLDAYPEIWEPLPDTAMQERPQQDIKEAIRSLYGGRPDVFVSGNTGVYYEEGNRDAVFLPDCYVVFGEGAERLWNPYAYRVWDFGKPPDFALEIGSKSTWQNDLGYKRDLYARVGIREYWRYDPTGGDYYGEPLVGEYLAGGQYQRFDIQPGPDGMIWAYSRVLRLELRYRDRQLELRDPATGDILGNAIVQREGRLAAEAAAQAEREGRLAAEAAAQAEREGRLAAEADVARLQRELRRLREG